MLQFFLIPFYVLCVQEIVTHYILLAYNIKWVTTSWTYCTWRAPSPRPPPAASCSRRPPSAPHRSRSSRTCISTVCPGSSDTFHIVSYYIKWVTTSWTHGISACIDMVCQINSNAYSNRLQNSPPPSPEFERKKIDSEGKKKRHRSVKIVFTRFCEFSARSVVRLKSNKIRQYIMFCLSL